MNYSTICIIVFHQINNVDKTLILQAILNKNKFV